jgi:ribosomal protein S18 acetylase RimI-like enzyme
LPTIFKIVDCEEHKVIDKRLEELNYDKIDLTSVQICNELNQQNCNLENITIGNTFTEDWKNCFYYSANIKSNETKDIIDNMLRNIKHDVISVHKIDNGKFIGCGYGVIEKDFVGLFDIIVNEEFRGKGYGKQIVHAILARAKETGAKKAYLLVVNNNIIAKTLYQNLGFREIYQYWYRNKKQQLDYIDKERHERKN